MILNLLYLACLLLSVKSQTICQPSIQTVCINSNQCFIVNNINSASLCQTNVIETTTTSTTTNAPTKLDISYCPSDLNICQNGGICLIFGGRDVTCSCRTGFSGIFLVEIMLLIF